jgi:ABC-2 type transport system ATP-binding protein
MEVHEYLTFVGRLKGIPSAELPTRVNEVMERCFVADVNKRLIHKLSKGYRQRVGLAQAIIHNPDVLILDEPTAGLDPKQIIETRALIKNLSGDHTIILSTHILPEVEQICEQVVIISKGKLVAKDSVANLTNRMHGAEAVALEVEPRSGTLDSAAVQRKLEEVPGVSRIIFKEARGSRLLFEAESLQGRSIRPELARRVVENGWNLNEIRSLAFSLEEIFLSLTGAEPRSEPHTTAPASSDENAPAAVASDDAKGDIQ